MVSKINPMEKNYFVYILSNKANNVIYTGVTSDLVRRVYEHKSKADPKSFTAKYNVHKLIYFEDTSDVYEAITREKQIKSWKRKKKNELINQFNPEWKDLYGSIIE